MDSEFIYRSIEQECSFSVMHEPSGVFRWHDSMKSLNASSVKKKEMNNIAKKYHSKFPFMKITKFIYILIQIINFNYIISSIKLFKIKKIKK